jgi:hypothetical protein
MKGTLGPPLSIKLYIGVLAERRPEECRHASEVLIIPGYKHFYFYMLGTISFEI